MQNIKIKSRSKRNKWQFKGLSKKSTDSSRKYYFLVYVMTMSFEQIDKWMSLNICRRNDQMQIQETA